MSKRREPNFGYLLGGILAFMLIGPIARQLFGAADGLIMMGAFTAMMFIGVWSLVETRLVFISGLLLAVTSVGLAVINDYYPSKGLDFTLMAILLTFTVISASLATTHLFGDDRVSANRLMGGICIYLLIGLTWSVLYSALMLMDPTSFAGFSVTGEESTYWEMTYFSFVTLTTLGYGDITPVTSGAKALAYSEAVAGELYIAVLIGALVGSYMSEKKSNN
jgi:voltage-gated potassium channel